MAKRLTDTEKWNDPWFRELSDQHRLLWLFVCDKADNAGVWKKDFSMASFLIGSKLEEPAALVAFNSGKSRIIPINSDYWLINDFVDFHFGDLKTSVDFCKKSRIQQSVIRLINQHREKHGYPEPF